MHFVSSATHRVDFIHGLPQIATFSDDKTAVVWDMSDETKLCTLTGHTVCSSFLILKNQEQ